MWVSIFVLKSVFTNELFKLHFIEILEKIEENWRDELLTILTIIVRFEFWIVVEL
jgi:hypothetical protein